MRKKTVSGILSACMLILAFYGQTDKASTLDVTNPDLVYSQAIGNPGFESPLVYWFQEASPDLDPEGLTSWGINERNATYAHSGDYSLHINSFKPKVEETSDPPAGSYNRESQRVTGGIEQLKFWLLKIMHSPGAAGYYQFRVWIKNPDGSEDVVWTKDYAEVTPEQGWVCIEIPLSGYGDLDYFFLKIGLYVTQQPSCYHAQFLIDDITLYQPSPPPVPEFPIGLAFEMLFIPVIIYMFWRSRQRKKISPQNSISSF